MSRSLNKAILIGNLGADPEIRSTNSGTRVATLSIATSRQWTNRSSGQQEEKTEWHRVVCWDKLADIIERYVKKGDWVYIEGQIEYRKYEDRDGVTKWSTEIRARELIMLGGSGRDTYTDAPSMSEGPEDSEFSNQAVAGEDDLPF